MIAKIVIEVGQPLTPKEKEYLIEFINKNNVIFMQEDIPEEITVIALIHEDAVETV